MVLPYNTISNFSYHWKHLSFNKRKFSIRLWLEAFTEIQTDHLRWSEVLTRRNPTFRRPWHIPCSGRRWKGKYWSATTSFAHDGHGLRNVGPCSGLKPLISRYFIVCLNGIKWMKIQLWPQYLVSVTHPINLLFSHKSYLQPTSQASEVEQGWYTDICYKSSLLYIASLVMLQTSVSYKQYI
jgi:hypothetical protein